MTLIVHINGWPGCGKLTIARHLARRLNAKLIDNHTLLNPAEVLFERRDPLHDSLRQAIRSVVFDHAARLPPDTSVVFTDALADDDWDRGMFDQYRDLAARRSGRLIAVVLDCDLDENIRRLTSAGRADLHKLTRPEILTQLRGKYTLLRPENANLVTLDISRLTPEQAVVAIEDGLPPQVRDGLPSAS